MMSYLFKNKLISNDGNIVDLHEFTQYLMQADLVYAHMEIKMNKSKIEELSKAAFQAKRKYEMLGMRNTFGLDEKEKEQLHTDYSIAQTEMIEARQALRAEQGADVPVDDDLPV